MERILKFEKRRKRILWVYSIAFLLLIIACFITFYANRQLVKQSSTIKSTNKLIINLEKILSTLNDAESGVRGYLATKQSEFLLHYYGSKKLTDSLYYETKLLASDNPTQQERLNRLKETYERRLNLLSVLVKQFDNGVQQIGDSLINQMILSKGTMDVCRSEVALLQNEEKRLLTVRDENLKTNIVIINSLTIISLLIAFILIIFAYLTYLRENIARKLVLTEVYNYQDELKKKVVQLNKANAELIRIRSIEKFAATGRIARTIAHEVRNPLTNIDLAVDQLQTEVVVQPDESSTMLFDIIKRNSNRINQLISDLLNSTKSSELATEKISINDLLDDSLKEAEDRITLANVEVVKKYSRDICDVAVDKEKIKIAFLNIIINAIEAMESKEGSMLTLETKGENDKCKVRIRDNGPGLDSESANRLFEPYFTSKAKGNGLGLTHTQNIILNHKGEIVVDTAPGKGSSFTIILDFPK